MIVLSVMYPDVQGSRFDSDYYVGQHLALVRRLLGSALKEISVMRGLSGGEPGAAPEYRVVAQFRFAGVEAMGEALGRHGEALFADIPNFTDVQPVVQVSELLV